MTCVYRIFFSVTYGNLHYPVQLKHIEILLGIYVKQECTLVFWDLCVGQWLLVTGLRLHTEPLQLPGSDGQSRKINHQPLGNMAIKLQSTI